MDYLVCPDDGERLTASASAREASSKPLVVCPRCGQRFTFSGEGLVVVRQNDDDESPSPS